MKFFNKKVTFIFCIAALLSSYANSGANRLYLLDFEQPLSETPELSWSPEYQARVDFEPKEGSYSVRSNFNESVTDPITKLPGNAAVHFDLDLTKIATISDWLKTTKSIYISWWFKLDKCLWKGATFSNSDPKKFTAKMAYLSMYNNSGTSYYLSGQGGATGEGITQVNYPDWGVYWEEWYNKASIYTSTGEEFGPDGKWHKLSVHITRTDTEKQFLQWWIDDSLMKAESVAINSKFQLYENYLIDSIGFWYTKQEIVGNSTNIEDGEYCNAWQIDQIEIWDGNPSNPPTSNKVNWKLP